MNKFSSFSDIDEITLNVLPYNNPDVLWESPLAGGQYYSDLPIPFLAQIVDDYNKIKESLFQI